MTLERFKLRQDGEHLDVTRISMADPPLGTALILHGAGTASKTRTYPLAKDLSASGFDVISFDFSGHGESSGDIRELSLERRHAQAAGIIESLVDSDRRLTLVGFSMSGQTIGDLLASHGDRIDRIALCSPAVYPQNAWTIPFTGEFSKAIRIDDAWRNSRALEQFIRFKGRAVLVIPGEDLVIPSAVTFEIECALQTHADFVGITFGEATHRIGEWLENHPESRRHLVRALTVK